MVGHSVICSVPGASFHQLPGCNACSLCRPELRCGAPRQLCQHHRRLRVHPLVRSGRGRRTCVQPGSCCEVLPACRWLWPSPCYHAACLTRGSSYPHAATLPAAPRALGTTRRPATTATPAPPASTPTPLAPPSARLAPPAPSPLAKPAPARTATQATLRPLAPRPAAPASPALTRPTASLPPARCAPRATSAPPTPSSKCLRAGKVQDN